MNVTDRQTDRRTDDDIYSEREREFTFAKTMFFGLHFILGIGVSSTISS